MLSSMASGAQALLLGGQEARTLMNNGTQNSSNYSNPSSAGSNLTDAVVDTMVRWPMRMTGATVDFMLQGVRQMTGSGGSRTMGAGYSNGSSATYESTTSSSGPSSSAGSGSGWTSLFTGGSASGTFDQDLSGDDLKYVIWSIVFTKPGYECILQTQQEELVNYAADSNTYAAVKIAKFLDSARHGHSDKPEAWGDGGYAGDTTKGKSGRKESTTVASTPNSTSVSVTSGSESRANAGSGDHDKGWRIPPEDQKYIAFLYKVDRRLPRQEEVTRVERVTVERNTRVV